MRISSCFFERPGSGGRSKISGLRFPASGLIECKRLLTIL
jgi:hypothetical protein